MGNDGGSHVMDWKHTINLEILLVSSCYGNWDKHMVLTWCRVYSSSHYCNCLQALWELLSTGLFINLINSIQTLVKSSRWFLPACTCDTVPIINYKSHASCYKAVTTDYPLLFLQAPLTRDCSAKQPTLIMISDNP